MIETGIKAGEIYVKDLFSNKYLFEVPDFQRPFSWETGNFEDLFDDINQAIQSNKERIGNKFSEYEPYFLGSIILWTKTFQSDGAGEYGVIDGQQRLTSLSILLAVLRDLAKDEDDKKVLQEMIYQKEKRVTGTPESVRLSVRDKEKDFFREFVLEPGGTKKAKIQNRDALSEPKQHIIDAINVFTSKCMDENENVNQDDLECLIKYFLQKVVLVLVRTNSLSSAFRLFNTINARGMELSNSDLLKSENLRVIKEEQRDEYTGIWEDMEEDIGTEKLEMLTSFVRTIRLKEKAEHSIFEEFEDKVFKKEPDFKGVKFIKYLSNVSTIYQNNILDGHIPTNNVPHEVAYYNLVSVMRDFLPFNDWMSALIVFSDKFRGQNLYDFLRKFESELVVNWVAGLSFTERLTRIYKVIKLIEDSDNPVVVLSNSLFNDDVRASKSAFKNNLNDVNFYNKGRGRISKYILLRVNMERKDNEDVRLSYGQGITVEHILPRTPTNDYWLEKFDETDRAKWTNRLGNLVLLNGRKNSQASNKPFTDKVKDYFLKRSDFYITEELRKYSQWNKDNLTNRHEDIINECLKIWIR